MGPESEATLRDGEKPSPAGFQYLVETWLKLSLLMHFSVA